MKRAKSPATKKSQVSSNDTGSTGGSSGHSAATQLTPPLTMAQSSSVTPTTLHNTGKSHRRTASSTSTSAHHQLGKNNAQTSNGSNEDIHENSNSNLDVTNNSNLADSTSRDDLDCLLPRSADAQKIRSAIEHLHSKINRTKEAIKAEQNARDENVNEYLKLAANADKIQLQRIKSVFEKKNQKSAQTIAHYQKKIDSYNKKIKEIEIHGIQAGHRHTREMIRDMGQGLKDVGVNIKEGFTGLSGGVIGGIRSGISTAGETVMSKPREFFKNRFGSADNLTGSDKFGDGNNTNENEGEIQNKNLGNVNVNKAQSRSHSHSTKYTSEDENSSITSGSGQPGIRVNVSAPISGSSLSPLRKLQSSNGNKFEENTSNLPQLINLEPILTELRERREECQRFTDEVEVLKNQLQSECSAFHQSLQEERYRFERLEEQMNDLIELHQNEIENLKQNITDMEEKVQYQSEERLRDVHEMLDSCQTRISKMEHQQHQHLQQLVNLDSLENSNARALILKLINVVLTILQVILLLVATIANILAPFLQTRVRLVTSIIVLFTIMFVCQQWPDYGNWLRQKLSEIWSYLSSILYR